MDVKRLSPNASLPRYATPGAAGMDLCACLSERVTLAPGERALIPTGLAVSIPQGYVGLVFARSGLAVKQEPAAGQYAPYNTVVHVTFELPSP